MSGIVPLDAGKAQAGGRLLKDAAINWVVLEDHQRIEERAQAREALDFSKAQMLVSDQLGLAVLEPSQKLAQRLSGTQPHADRQGVNKQANHGLHAADLRRPAGHRRAEDHVIAPGQPAQQDGPGALEDRVEGQARDCEPDG